eukprot:scaffold2218_cov20-Tisochrysis_lutea.AAC.3
MQQLKKSQQFQPSTAVIPIYDSARKPKPDMGPAQQPVRTSTATLCAVTDTLSSHSSLAALSCCVPWLTPFHLTAHWRR